MRRRLSLIACIGLVLACGAPSAHAVPFDVYALANSTNIGGGGITGTPVSTGLFLETGDVFTVSVAIDDLWSAGNDDPLPRTSNADGLTGVGPYGGGDYGPLMLGSFSAPYGALVGRLGSQLFLLGTSFTSPPLVLGGPTELELFYWDTFTPDNTGFVTADVEVVPEPATLLLLGSGLAGVAIRRRRRNG